MTTAPPFQDPFEWFARWFDEAKRTISDNPDAMALATIDAEGRPSIRQVLLKGFGPRGFVFHTNYGSRKAREIDAHPAVALNLYWRGLERQVRIEGKAERLGAAESDAYFATRSRESQLGAWAARQSRPLASRRELLERIAHFEEKFSDSPVPRPPHWGGYRVVPERIEFWQARPHRLHTRWVFERPNPEASWDIGMLYP
jgi:pyridoxamine 5'-phosphate oxidase